VPVLKTYDKADTEAAINRGDDEYFKRWRSVRSDVDNATFNSDAFGRDVGHTFRHIEGTAAPGKSTYADRDTAVQVTMQLLNSANGQRALRKLDQDSPGGSFIEPDPANRRITSTVTGDYYGSETPGGAKKKITKAVCEVMKLGESVLWVHSTYPDFR
jgi:hypothetical protein